MKKLFICQPMRGLTNEEISKVYENIKIRVGNTIFASKDLDPKDLEPIVAINSFEENYREEKNKHVFVWLLGKSIQLLSEADIVYFGGDWRNDKECRMLYEIAKEYGLDRIEE